MHKSCLTVLLVLRGLIICVCSSDEHPGLYKDTTLISGTYPCLKVRPPCMTEADRFSLEALQHIHREMDDDQDGGIEVEESVEFIIEDMQQQQQANKHSKLHQEDQHITLEELWKGWKSSEVHNWTQEDVLRWLREFVELTQYEKGFKELHVNGNTLPRIAANEPSFMSTYLKIQDQQHKQKLKLKALDVVLFGPPTRPPHNWMKDLVLIVSVVMGVGGCWFAKVQNKASKVHITKMMKDLESLQRAEQSLRDLQEQLEKAQEEKRTVAVEKKNLEEKMRNEIQGAQEEANRLHKLRDGAVSELSRLWYAEEELGQVRNALKRAEKDMQSLWSVPETLQLWLQLTYEVEVQYYNVKKQSAEQQLVTAKDEVEKRTVSPLKCSPRSLVCSRRSGHIVPSPVIVSPDPDLLIPIRTPVRRYGDEEEEEHIKFSPLVRQDSMETSSDPDSIGSSINRMYSTLDVSTRRKYIFSDKMPRKISLDEQEDIPSRKISEEEMDESLVNTLRKVSRDELDINTPSRKTSRDELEATVDHPKQLGRGEIEASIDSRKSPRDLPLDSTMRYYSTEKMCPTAFSMDTQRQRSLRDRKDHMDSISRVIPKAELNKDTTRYSDALMNTSIKRKENLDFPTNIQRGRVFRENSFDATFDSSVESSKQLKMLGKTYSSKDIPSRMTAQDEFDVPTDFERQKIRDISMDTATKNILKEEFERSKSFKENREIPSKKISRDEQDIAMETQRIQRKIDSSVETPIGKIQREMVGLSVEATRRKISQEEFLVTNPPDLTVCSVMLWKPASDSLSTLVYDGILDKSNENPLMPSPGDLSHASSVSCSSQSLLGNEGQSANLSSSESCGRDKGKKSSKLKNIFKKIKGKEKDKDS
ncbi:hypothetical protein cypCar_00022549 [Cyprinus carpio]|nr:hypothetical protein cypCar_00022549 [Cyprinus carpio]